MTMNGFDPPSKLKLLLEPRAFLELASYFPARGLMRKLPKGDGHPVIIYPGFMASDLSTRLMRRLLTELGYEALPWKLGRNLGYSPPLAALMTEHLASVHKHYGCKISLVGWSLGGVYARETARELPQCVRQVITMGSPIGGSGKDTNVHWLYDLVAGERLSDIDPALLARMKQPIPVPSTAIYSRGDGIVAWQACREQFPDEQHENIRVAGSHFGLGFNPLVMNIVADRLAQPEDARMPFDFTGWRGVLYPDRFGRSKGAIRHRRRWSDLELALKNLEQRLENA